MNSATEVQNSCNKTMVTGLEFYSTDGGAQPPKITDLDESQIEDWFTTHSDAAIKILSLRLDHSQGSRRAFNVPFSRGVVDHAIWQSQVYYNLTACAGGGAAGLIDEPPRFVLQTPSNGPFCSLAMSKRGTVVKGVYSYSDETFSPTSILAEELSPSSWRQSGLQIINLPQAILRQTTHSLSADLTALVDQIDRIESTLAASPSTPLDFAAQTRTLHTSHLRLLNLQRRTRFASTLITAIETSVTNSKHNKIPWPPITPQKSLLSALTFDFDDLPRRIENCRATITGLIQQHNEQMNLEIAEASRQMAAFALSDNASMKTIAIMTMVFLPGTAVASFFSMSMFNWGAGSGSDIASKWLWVFFVVAVPLSAAVVAVWWIWTGRMQRRLEKHEWVGAVRRESQLEDFEVQVQKQSMSMVK